MVVCLHVGHEKDEQTVMVVPHLASAGIRSSSTMKMDGFFQLFYSGAILLAFDPKSWV